MTRISMLGVRLDLFTMEQLTDLVGSALASRRRIYISNHNLHSLYLLRHCPELNAVYDSMDYAHVDGMPLVFMGRSMGIPIRPEHRIAYIDWLPRLFRTAERKRWRLLYVGSKPGVAECGATRFRRIFPNLNLRTMDGYFDTNPDSRGGRAAIDQINGHEPDILFVGMGMPRQEKWISKVRDRLLANVVFASCGATMDYFAGEIPTPPRWAGPLGFEWAFRLASRPLDLWPRYLSEPWSILPVYLGELLSARHQTTTSLSD
jgi:N-acetylglucosaminyldiphosphoundecaprenol N-acetyl-beta-D-mannosaminyltransferase